MAIAVGVWSLEVPPGDPIVINPPADLRITNVALGDEIKDEKSRTTVKLVYRTPGVPSDSDDEDDDRDDDKSLGPDDRDPLTTTVLCSLTLGKIEQATVDVVLTEDAEYIIELVGKNTVHLTGNYIDQRPPDQDPFSDEESEDDFDLRDVSSDVEVDPNELDIPTDGSERFEEIVDEEPSTASKKRRRESDAMETEEPAEKPSKAQKKKQKKLKNANGEAVAAPSPEKSDKKEDEKTKSDDKEKKEKGDKKKDKVGEVKTIQGGVQVVDSKVGTGPKAKAGNVVSLRYIGKLQNGKVFDQNTKGEPFKFRLGRGEVIKGWDVGVAGMQVGGERILTIPPAMAYGKKGDKTIPANSTLIFEVKVLSIKP
ncbi:hypothetical protein BD311DRAFT_787713 [Dichomitus squalens]|uniref:FK506-binding protein n=1 Tax=Dichomitus squalens TaxID=114155 RepID=A0A4Q9MPP8_9APHY|nr:hypothetical protein BD311DRAFT_787713 [Dichomitus squalens]